MVVDELSATEVDRIFHALADSTRRSILTRVLDGELSVSALAREYPISLTAVQKHVGVLASAGLVAKQRNGREQLVSGRMAQVARARRLLDEYERIWRGRVDRMRDLLDERPHDTEGES